MRLSKRQIIIIGSGIAGLYAALKLAENGIQVLLVTKSTLGESNSRYAQGGIVAVLPENNKDSVELHVKDTIKAGAGLTDPYVAKFISGYSSEIINDLVNYGVEFDKDNNNKIALTLEAAHSVRRILHSGGDCTGKSIELVLSSLVEIHPNITIYQKTQVVDLLIDTNKVCNGVIVFKTEEDEYETVFSSAVVIATGGAGQVYSNTTNPKIATGDGIALAYRAGAVIQDMEFVQFHPTALTIKDNETRFLISESVRGEGAKLKNLNNELFTLNYDKKGDLAPRDIVTRAIFLEMQRTNTPHVLLDTSLIDSEMLKIRFPNIIRVCEENNFDILNGSIPISPAAHYIMGGIKSSIEGKTSIPRLFTIGEASCTSLHGANRLASNSLLECVVISKQMTEYIKNSQLILEEVNSSQLLNDNRISSLIDQYDRNISGELKDHKDSILDLKNIMWQNAGIIRNGKNLAKALEIINVLRSDFNKNYKCDTLDEYEFRNLLIIAELIVKSAISRKESRGAHFREDYPKTDNSAYHSYIKKGEILAKNVVSFT